MILRMSLQLDETGKRKLNALHLLSPAMEADLLALARAQGMPAVEDLFERSFQKSLETLLAELSPWEF